jgi:hypothetical protein
MAKPKEKEKSPIDVEIKEPEAKKEAQESPPAKKKAGASQKKGRKHVAQGRKGFNAWAFIALVLAVIVVVLLAYNPGERPYVEEPPAVDDVPVDESPVEEVPEEVEPEEETEVPDYVFTINVTEGANISLIERFIDYEAIWFSEPLDEQGYWETKEGDAGEYYADVVMTADGDVIERKILIIVNEAPAEDEIEEVPEEGAEEAEEETVEEEIEEEDDSNIILEQGIIEVE